MDVRSEMHSIINLHSRFVTPINYLLDNVLKSVSYTYFSSRLDFDEISSIFSFATVQHLSYETNRFHCSFKVVMCRCVMVLVIAHCFFYTNRITSNNNNKKKFVFYLSYLSVQLWSVLIKKIYFPVTNENISYRTFKPNTGVCNSTLNIFHSLRSVVPLYCIQSQTIRLLLHRTHQY